MLVLESGLGVACCEHVRAEYGAGVGLPLKRLFVRTHGQRSCLMQWRNMSDEPDFPTRRWN